MVRSKKLHFRSTDVILGLMVRCCWYHGSTTADEVLLVAKDRATLQEVEFEMSDKVLECDCGGPSSCVTSPCERGRVRLACRYCGIGHPGDRMDWRWVPVDFIDTALDGQRQCGVNGRRDAQKG